MLRVAVCDDCKQFADRFGMLLQDLFARMGVNCRPDSFYSGEELITAVEGHGIYDIIFLDIEMTGINGIETARYIRNKYPEAVFVFISAYSSYYEDAFDVQPYHFLLKSVNTKQLYAVLLRLSNFVFTCQQVLTFSFDRIHYRINIADIIYLESRQRTIQVVGRDFTYQFYGKLSEIENILSNYNFIFLRIHSSFLVNTNYITIMQSGQVVMANGDALPVSASRRPTLKKFIEKNE